MGLRNVKRQIAKARLTIMGVGNVNRKLARKRDANGKQDKKEIPNWKRALYGKTGEEAARAQANHGRLLKAKEQGRAATNRRKVKKVTA